MGYRLTSAQRCVLADDTRAAVLGWLLTDPDVGQQARRIEGKATTIVGFSFSRFASMALDEIGSDYRPRSTTPGIVFPLTIAEGFALANNIELEMANEDQLSAAGLIAAYSPYGQPEVCSRDWRTHVGCLAALGLSACSSSPAPAADTASAIATVAPTALRRLRSGWRPVRPGSRRAAARRSPRGRPARTASSHHARSRADGAPARHRSQPAPPPRHSGRGPAPRQGSCAGPCGWW